MINDADDMYEWYDGTLDALGEALALLDQPGNLPYPVALNVYHSEGGTGGMLMFMPGRADVSFTPTIDRRHIPAAPEFTDLAWYLHALVPALVMAGLEAYEAKEVRYWQRPTSAPLPLCDEVGAAGEQGALQQRVDDAVGTLRFNLQWAVTSHPAVDEFSRETALIYRQCDAQVSGERRPRVIPVACRAAPRSASRLTRLAAVAPDAASNGQQRPATASNGQQRPAIRAQRGAATAHGGRRIAA
ncbi:hypothetical protein [Streptomyces sp. NPDC056255]|uniref:hypothetical protein n=1 Tax=Streptomyces sp. NPDC056255 TaxID=3345764 RepID=UPI0035DE566F